VLRRREMIMHTARFGLLICVGSAVLFQIAYLSPRQLRETLPSNACSVDTGRQLDTPLISSHVVSGSSLLICPAKSLSRPSTGLGNLTCSEATAFDPNHNFHIDSSISLQSVQCVFKLYLESLLIAWNPWRMKDHEECDWQHSHVDKCPLILGNLGATLM
jgi:hypothetical protein